MQLFSHPVQLHDDDYYYYNKRYDLRDDMPKKGACSRMADHFISRIQEKYNDVNEVHYHL